MNGDAHACLKCERFAQPQVGDDSGERRSGRVPCTVDARTHPVNPFVDENAPEGGSEEPRRGENRDAPQPESF